MKIIEIKPTQAKRKLRISLSEKLPYFMGKIIASGGRHPLAEDLFSAILVLYKGQDSSVCSEKRMLQACSDLLNNGICEWESRDNFVRFSEIPEEILREAIWQMPERIETAEDLRLYLLPTHLKNAIKTVCNGPYSQAMLVALQQLELGLPRGTIPLSVWNAAMKIPAEVRKRNLCQTSKDAKPCSTIPISVSLIPHCAVRNPAMTL